MAYNGNGTVLPILKSPEKSLGVGKVVKVVKAVKVVRVNKRVGVLMYCYVALNREIFQKLDKNATLLFVTLELSSTPNIFYLKVHKIQGKKISLHPK